MSEEHRIEFSPYEKTLFGAVCINIFYIIASPLFVVFICYGVPINWDVKLVVDIIIIISIYILTIYYIKKQKTKNTQRR
jgi:hypothetical protein